MSRLETGSLVYVEWLDHAGQASNRWEYESDLGTLQPGLVRSVGWVIREDRQALVIVSNHAEHSEDYEPELQGVHCILKSCITRRVTLRDPSRRK